MLEFILLFAIIVCIIAAIALIRGLINNAIVRAQAKKGGYVPPKKEPTHNPDWIWNEERKLWVHKSEIEREKRNYNTTQASDKTDGSYHYKGRDITDEWLRVTQNNTPKPENRKNHTYSEPKHEPPKANYVWESAEWKPKPPQGPKEYKTTQRKQEQPKTTPVEQNSRNSEYTNAYEATPILTQNEMRNFRTLYDAAIKKGYIVNSKVRLADIVKPRNDPQYMSRFGKIKSKHVDFVILDINMRVKAIIELDDSSHDRKDRKERDEFVDTILEDCGYKIIHTRHITSDILDNI